MFGKSLATYGFPTKGAGSDLFLRTNAGYAAQMATVVETPSIIDPAARWPRWHRMPELTSLEPDTLAAVMAAVQRLRESVDDYCDVFLKSSREYVAGYDELSDEEIRESARFFVEGEISELASYKIPYEALRDQLERHAMQRVAQGVSIEALSLGFRVGTREMLTLIDRIAAEVNLPSDLLLAIHDSSWEFANEAATVFARVHRELTVERARLDAERRAAFARGVLDGSIPTDQIHRDAALFGLDPRRDYTPIVSRTASSADANSVRRAIATAARMTPDRLLFVDLGELIGCIAPIDPSDVDGGELFAVGRTSPLDFLNDGFNEAVLALETAERFGLRGSVRLENLGPRPLVLSESRAAAGLEIRHFARLDDVRVGDETEETTRVYLECDQHAGATAARLTVHPNTVRYRVGQFREMTGLDLRRTDDLVAAWWLLNRRRPVAPSSQSESS